MTTENNVPEKPVFQEIDPKLAQWREAGKHLPEFLRDFHDQKAVFSAMHTLMSSAGQVDPVLRDKQVLSWVEGQIYVIDKFLWFMARHGYTLQKSRANQKFEELQPKIDALAEKRTAMLQEMFKNAKANPSDS